MLKDKKDKKKSSKLSFKQRFISNIVGESYFLNLYFNYYLLTMVLNDHNIKAYSVHQYKGLIETIQTEYSVWNGFEDFMTLEEFKNLLLKNQEEDN